MKLLIAKDYEDMSKKAAQIIIDQVKQKPDSVLGLATGGTVIGTYKMLVDDHKRHRTSYKQVRTVNLDEYVGLHPSNKNSYHYFMKTHFFDHVDLPANQTFIPNGLADQVEEECKQYEQLIAQLGGIDLQLLGIGRNGHIGFNEPGTPFSSKTHCVTLTESTRLANARFFKSVDEVPTHAITMGISTIMKSKKLLLLASGTKKAIILSRFFNEEVNEQNPATILKTHKHVTIIADEQALSLMNLSHLHFA
jgi:glucosamine-6-phosphate deaminase